MMNFVEKLDKAVNQNNSLVCVGLDPDVSKLPQGVDQLAFTKAIVDATHDLVCCFKPNSAFYESQGAVGIQTLKDICDYINQKYPEIPIILDYKRGDIGNTNEQYAQFAFDYLNVDAVTYQIYMGIEPLEPLLARADKVVFALIRTSNPGGGEVQDLVVDGKPLYEYLTDKVANDWNKTGNLMLVAGATYPAELAKMRQIAGDKMSILVPGVGSQGADPETVIKAGLNSKGTGLIINASRSIIFASNSDNFAEVARDKATELRDEINLYRGES